MEEMYTWIDIEDICEEAIRLVAETFDSFGVSFFVTNFEGHEILTVPLLIANTPTLEMQFVVDENPNSVLSSSILKARVYGLYHNVPYGPLMKIYNILNNWNGKSIFMSFHMDSEREIYMKYDFPASCSKSEVLGRMALEVLSDTKQFLMENYCDLLNILKTDEDGEFVPQHKWKEDNAFLKKTCRNDYPLSGNMLVIRLEEIYGSMEYQCWVPFEEKS